MKGVYTRKTGSHICDRCIVYMSVSVDWKVYSVILTKISQKWPIICDKH